MIVVDPTVMALGSPAGELRQASALLFPAATTITTPALAALRTALFKASLRPPPRLMLATHFRPATAAQSVMTCSMPSITPEYEPLPSLPRTRTAQRSVHLATP